MIMYYEDRYKEGEMAAVRHNMFQAFMQVRTGTHTWTSPEAP